ncbi:SGNH/GDSL hydrolase family protein [Nocardioides sp. Kera G14]|uniref:SGNH/GDSL hydrolase family protein n=1 Tax=Nocardioides sp. Kera G14 TaxID=2884264 RepID=UPI001D1178A3|nr:SGNH/GDSL hydrolase family protein [Nocardioides sp. Kera G14]UDY23374.1 SGNH/GDSL hydrolase family protein [Nocardioides sp. Kera G14]
MRRLVSALVASALIGSLSGCGSDEPTTYVALGDSYTAAPYIGTLDGSDGCFRSTNDYPHLLAKQAKLVLDDVSCSSATTEAVTSSQRTPQGSVEAPQIDAIDKDTDLVTVGLGANDFDLFGRVVLTCVQLSASDPSGSPCTTVDAAGGENSVANRLADVEKRLVSLFHTIRKAAPDARIVAVGYPQVVPTPEQGGCSELPIATGDLGWAYDLNVGINAAVQKAADATKVDFVDVLSGTKGHDICGDDPWIAGATVAPGRKGFAYHPYTEEQEYVAKLLEELVSAG